MWSKLYLLRRFWGSHSVLIFAFVFLALGWAGVLARGAGTPGRGRHIRGGLVLLTCMV